MSNRPTKQITAINESLILLWEYDLYDSIGPAVPEAIKRRERVSKAMQASANFNSERKE